jgi:hypothetical protein
MTIRPVAGESTPDDAAPRATPRDAHSRWLLELERAQLARQARQRQAGDAPTRPPENAFETQAKPRDASQSANSPHGRSGERHVGQQSTPAQSGTVVSRSGPGQQSGTATQNLPVSGEARIAREEAARTAAPAAPRPAARPVPVTWPKVNVHAHWNGAALEVWVRDATLGDKARRRLAARLRGELPLERLTVNGEEIYREENTAWPSKR